MFRTSWSNCHSIFRVHLSNVVAGRTLTSAPVSTRNCCCFVIVSEGKRRPLLRPAIVPTTGSRPAHFLTRCKVACIVKLVLQTCDDSSTGLLGRECKSRLWTFVLLEAASVTWWLKAKAQLINWIEGLQNRTAWSIFKHGQLYGDYWSIMHVQGKASFYR